MGKGTYTGKYNITVEEYRAAYWYAMQYKSWKQKCNMEPGKEETGKLIEKIGIIERTVMEADADIYNYLLKAVTTRDLGYERLRAEGMPCGRNRYYSSRRNFYYLLSKKI